jgi:hypothetical protein
MGALCFPCEAESPAFSGGPSVLPAAAKPDVARLRRYADDLYLRRRRSHVNGAADIDHGCRNPDGPPDHAATEQRSSGKRCK